MRATPTEVALITGILGTLIGTIGTSLIPWIRIYPLNQNNKKKVEALDYLHTIFLAQWPKLSRGNRIPQAPLFYAQELTNNMHIHSKNADQAWLLHIGWTNSGEKYERQN